MEKKTYSSFEAAKAVLSKYSELLAKAEEKQCEKCKEENICKCDVSKKEEEAKPEEMKEMAKLISPEEKEKEDKKMKKCGEIKKLKKFMSWRKSKKNK